MICHKWLADLIKFLLSEYPNVIKEMNDISLDFLSDSHYIARWFGVNQFILLSPVDKKDQIGTDDKAKLLLSSAAIAMINASW